MTPGAAQPFLGALGEQAVATEATTAKDISKRLPEHSCAGLKEPAG